ncbi:MAG: coproporphyrinogen III oxidase [Phycisphaerae bacterium]|nr:MAG: coproporphyrinogen III oxidase [Phycisphaerae bacterium]
MALAAAPAHARAGSLYLHVPFCFHKCHYCDFYSLVDTRDRQAPFVDRLIEELAALAPSAQRPLQTIFVGGGTPSLLRTDLWERLLAALDRWYDLASIRAGSGEFTVECNPETVTPDLTATLRAGGVTRVSMGAQSFNRTHLKALERWHDPDNVPRALTLARDAGISRASIDLIFAIPGQSLADVEQDLDTALRLGVTHLSCYALTYEPHTAMTARLTRGEFQRADEDLEADMFLLIRERLAAAGLSAYEVSNFARPGEECRHNLAYWRQDSWLAAGPSASGHLAGVRWKNAPRLDDYLASSTDGFAPIVEFEPLDPRRALAERLMTGLRLREGLDEADMLDQAARLDHAAPARLRACAERHRRAGLMHPGPRWALTDSGILIADRAAVEFLAALSP